MQRASTVKLCLDLRQSVQWTLIFWLQFVGCFFYFWMLQPIIRMQKNPSMEINNRYLINYGLLWLPHPKARQHIQKESSTSNKHSLASKKSWLPLPIKSSQADLLANLAVHKFLDAGRSTASLNTA